jgi:FAD/FMN-containing dehydrogenase
VRSGGHGISGRSTNDGGIVIDVGALDDIRVLDRGTGRVRLGPGARWGDVARALAPHGLGMSSGDFGDVGVGGSATAGGVGYLARRHGLTIDHVVAAELVLADGTQVRADAEHHPDLLWAVRGAGGNFGIVTAVELEAYEVGDVVLSTMTLEAGPELLERWGAALEAAPRELTSSSPRSPGGAARPWPSSCPSTPARTRPLQPTPSRRSWSSGPSWTSGPRWSRTTRSCRRTAACTAGPRARRCGPACSTG